MPPTSPLGVPAITVVFAKLLRDGQNFGVKPFLVPITDGNHVTPGVICQYVHSLSVLIFLKNTGYFLLEVALIR